MGVPCGSVAISRAVGAQAEQSQKAKVETVRVRDEQEWESAFAADMGAAFQGAADAATVPFEYMPNAQRIPDGFGVVQMLANAALRAKRPYGAIYSVRSVPQPAHGWILVCDHKQHAHAVMLVGHDWKLREMSSVRQTASAKRP